MKWLFRLIWLPLAILVSHATLARASVDEGTDTCAVFRGEVLGVSGNPKIVITPSAGTEKITDIGIGTPLCAGDKIQVYGPGEVRIIASPVFLDYTLTQSNQEYTIGVSENSAATAHAPGWFSALSQSVIRVLVGPAVEKPTATLPKRSLFCGTYSKNGTTLDLEEEQMLIEGQDRISLHWLGMPAVVRVIATPDGRREVLFEAAADELEMVAELSRALETGDTLVIELQSAIGINSRKINVVAQDHLPFPQSPTESPVLSEEDWRAPSNRALYAIWLAMYASPKWQLQGMSLLKDAASQNPAARKMWLTLWKEPYCSDDF